MNPLSPRRRTRFWRSFSGVGIFSQKIQPALFLYEPATYCKRQGDQSRLIVSNLLYDRFIGVTMPAGDYTIPRPITQVAGNCSRLPWKQVHRHAYTLPQVWVTCGRVFTPLQP